MTSSSAVDWQRVSHELDAHGCATTGPLLSAADCTALVASYAADDLFRRQVIMARQGYGRGEYKYFDYPLPKPVASLRAAFYPPLAMIANRWNETMKIAVRFPPEHAAFLDRCRKAGQVKPTPLL